MSLAWGCHSTAVPVNSYRLEACFGGEYGYETVYEGVVPQVWLAIPFAVTFVRLHPSLVWAHKPRRSCGCEFSCMCISVFRKAKLMLVMAYFSGPDAVYDGDLAR